MKRLISILTLMIAVLTLQLPQTTYAAVGDSVYVAHDGPVIIKVLGTHTSFNDTLSVYSKSGTQTSLFTSTTADRGAARLPAQQAGSPLLFQTSGGFSTGAFGFNLSQSFLQLAEVRWLTGNRAEIGFPSGPSPFGGSGLHIQVSNVSASVPEPSTWLVSILGSVLALLLFRARRPESMGDFATV